LWLPFAQIPRRNVDFVIKTAGDPAALIEPMRRVIAEIDPELPVNNPGTMQSFIDESLAGRRTPMILAAGFAAVALLLAAIGIYGVLAYLVSQRRREIGVRIALGSSAPEVFRLIMREGATILTAGLVAGIVGAWLLRSGIESQLYDIDAMDPLVIVAVAGALALVALAACAAPALRATHVDPVTALRQE
jgi:ABC-type lipoprotein release transport system permease subunit